MQSLALFLEREAGHFTIRLVLILVGSSSWICSSAPPSARHNLGTDASRLEELIDHAESTPMREARQDERPRDGE